MGSFHWIFKSEERCFNTNFFKCHSGRIKIWNIFIQIQNLVEYWKMNKTYYVYILTNKRNSTLYIGVTGDLAERVYQHKQKRIEGFTKRYNLEKLVYYEEFESIYDAIDYEKRLKGWRRDWKVEKIRGENPEFKDLYEECIQL